MGIFYIGALFRDSSVHYTIILAKNIFRNLGLYIVGAPDGVSLYVINRTV